MKKNILGVDITDAPSGEILEYVMDFLKNSREKMYIVTPNPEMVMHSRDHVAFRTVLNGAGIALCDGIGLYKAARFLGNPVKERITGTDFMEELCKESVKNAVTVGFLGGRNRVAERAAECLREKYPGLRIVFTASEWGEDGYEKAEQLYSSSDARSSHSARTIDILFVAYGFPKQEEWMAEHLEKLPVRVMMGVGGAFDYFSGNVGRAPKAVQSVGLEWLYRLIRQPWRLKRQLALPRFILLVVKERLMSK